MCIKFVSPATEQDKQSNCFSSGIIHGKCGSVTVVKFSGSALCVQYNFSGSDTDGSFTTVVSNSFLSPLDRIPQMQIWDNLV